MNKFIKENWKSILQVVALALFIIGTIDPLEGSVLIIAGSILLATLSFINKNPAYKIYLTASTLITIGVVFIFYIASIGGFGGSSTLSLWYGLLILPYPIGWLILVLLLIWNYIKKIKLKLQNRN